MFEAIQGESEVMKCDVFERVKSGTQLFYNRHIKTIYFFCKYV